LPKVGKEPFYELALLGAALLLPVKSHAQTAPCGLTSMTETVAPVYPPIAKAAHISGTVILLVRFKLDGSVDDTSGLSGPLILERAAVEFVHGWHANLFSGPRECPIVLNFELVHGDSDCDIPPEPARPFERVDLQHVLLRGRVISICDPGGMILRRKHRFLIF
jgi:hypothetical protein